MGFDEHDNLWVDGMHVSLPNGENDFIMEYYVLLTNNGELKIEQIEPCPYERMDTDGFEKYQIEPASILMAKNF